MSGWAPFQAVNTPAVSSGWAILPIGAGGYLTRMSIQYDGTTQSMVTPTDTQGAWYWNATATAPNGVTGAWQQLINSSAMPSTFVTNGAALNNGVYAIEIAPSAACTFYMVFNTYDANQYPPFQGVYKTTNCGAAWTLTNFTHIDVKQDFNSGDNAGTNVAIKGWGPKIGIDPTTPNTVYVGTGNNGLFVSLDGGTTWGNVSTGQVPTPSTACGGNCYPGYAGLIVSKFNHDHAYVYSYGNGIYYSANTQLGTSSTWTQINSGSGPTIVVNAQEDPANGNYYAVDGSGNVWQYNLSSTTWTEIWNSGNIFAVAVDPNTANHVIIGNGNGLLAESTNGTSFGTQSGQSTSDTNDVLWLNAFTANIYDLHFDPQTAKKLYTTTNRAAFTTTYSGTISSSTTINWALQSRGIEQLVANRVVVPITNIPVTATWDTAVFKPAEGSYPSAPVLPTGATTLFGAWSTDYCKSNHADMVVLADGAGDGSGQHSSYSTNTGGAWATIGAIPSNAYNGSTGNGNGSIACSSPTNVIWAPGGGVQPSYTTNCCTSPTWTGITLPSSPSWSTLGGGQGGAQVIAADEVNYDTGSGGTFYLFLQGQGFYVTTNGGASWALMTNGAYTSSVGQAQIKATPGEAGDFWFSGGNNEPGNRQPCGTDLIHYSGTTLTKITNLVCPYTVGLGANSGAGYPSVFVVGFVSGVYGIWRSDNASSGATPTWNQVGPWPYGNMDLVADISGDPSVYNRAYIGFRGSGYAKLNYLLRRDLDPASNDNTPVGINQAA